MRKCLFLAAIVAFAMNICAADKKENKQVVSVSANGVTTEVEFYSADIVRVVKYDAALTARPAHKSYSVIMTPQAVDLKFGDDSNAKNNRMGQRFVTVSSSCITVTIDKANGQVTFADNNGGVLLSESKSGKTTLIADGANKGKYAIEQAWALDKDEQIFGLGQRREEAMSQRGEKVELWNTNTHIFIPYFTSQKGYGVYWDNSGRTFYDNKSNEAELVMSSTVSPCIDYYFMYSDGSQDGVVASIHKLSGKPTMFPLWTMGFWQCRERYKTPDELAGVLDEFRRRQVPLDGIVQDWQYWGCDSNWNAMSFQNPHYLNKIGDPKQMRFLPNDENPAAEIEKQKKQGEPRLKTPQDMIDYVHENNAHLMISIWPDFGPWTPQYKAFDKIGALYPFETWPRNRGVKVYDPFNPKARDLYWKYLTTLYNMGFDAWWTDSTEPDHFEANGDCDFMTHEGTWESVKNAFPLMTNRGIYEHQRKMKNNSKRSFQMTRSGAFGIQHYGTFSWSGDVNSSWKEMKNQIPSGLNYVLCGIPMWNTDLGGFFCWDYNNDPHNPYGQELNVRWLQWGTFMPLMRSHCSSPMVSEIYKFGEPGDWAYDAMKEAIELRYSLLPYTYSLLGASVQSSQLMMRPFVMDFPADKKAITLNDEYMFGSAFLVKPVTDPLYTWIEDNKRGHAIYEDVKKAAAPVNVYLPNKAADGKSQKTAWYNFWTNEKKDGGRTYKVLSPINQMPVFVRAGSIVPFGPQVQYSGEKAWDNLEIRVYPGADAEFTLYEDAGDGYDYEKGEFTQIKMVWDDAARTLTIAPRKGQYKGMIAERQFRVNVVGGKSQTVKYSGAETKSSF